MVAAIIFLGVMLILLVVLVRMLILSIIDHFTDLVLMTVGWIVVDLGWIAYIIIKMCANM